MGVLVDCLGWNALCQCGLESDVQVQKTSQIIVLLLAEVPVHVVLPTRVVLLTAYLQLDDDSWKQESSHKSSQVQDMQGTSSFIFIHQMRYLAYCASSCSTGEFRGFMTITRRDVVRVKERCKMTRRWNRAWRFRKYRGHVFQGFGNLGMMRCQHIQ